MVVIQTIDIRNTQILHRLFLNQLNPLLPLGYCWSLCARCIQDRSHLPLRDKCIEHLLVQFPNTLGITLIDIYWESTQLVDNLLVGHLQQILDFCFRSAILLHH